jgi:quinol monooxygenase YgiN
MAETTVTVTVTLKIKTGYEERARGILKSIVGESRKENGCLEYGVYESMIYPLEFMVYMRWRDEAAFEKHILSAHVRAFDELQAKELLAGPYELKRWLPLG